MQPLRSAPATAPLPEAPLPDDLVAPDLSALVQHPDGWYWLADGGRQQFGPFETAEQARADMLAAADDEDLEPGESLQEAEDELGLATWIDPDTGALAEATRTRIEEH
jgi:hypothetical protein